MFKHHANTGHTDEPPHKKKRTDNYRRAGKNQGYYYDKIGVDIGRLTKEEFESKWPHGGKKQ